ncbi:MAG: hypothetical protein V4726_12205 [Verrucomicrobiota bacterium]
MRLPIQRREKGPLAATVVFIAAGIAGWLSVPPESAAGPLSGASALPSPVLAPAGRNAGAAAPVTAAVSGQTSSGAVAARLERELLTALDPGATHYSGERLMELCMGEYAQDLPGGNAAFEYAWRWAKTAPEEMHAWFRARGTGEFSLPARNSNYGFGNSIFSEWAKKDPDRAIAAALQGENPNLRRSSLADVIEALRVTDPARAAALTAENAALLVTPPNSSSLFSAYGKEYRTTWDFLSALPPGKDRGALLARFFDEMARYHRKETSDLWKELSPESRQELVAGGFSGFGFRTLGGDDKSASVPEGLDELRRDQVAADGDPEAVKAYLRIEALKWAETDPAAAIAWSREHVTGEAQVTGTARLFRTGAEHQFDATLAAWQSLPDGGLRARAAGQLAAGAPADRKAEAEALVATLSPADQATAKAAMQETRGGFRLSGP